MTLESITVTGPNKTEYEIGDELDLTGLVVTAHYSDGNEKVLSAGDYEVSGFDSSTAGEKTITVTYQGKTETFTVTVKEAEKPVVTLESITVSGPTKTEYEIDDELDLTGLVVTAHYSDGSEAAVEDYEVSGFDSSTAGEKTITVTYQDKTTTFTVNVKEAAPVVTLESITVTGPNKTEYEIGDELDLTGLVVTAHYSDGNEKVLSAGDYEVSGFDSSTAGEKTVTVTYQGETVSFKITVKEDTASSEQPGESGKPDDNQSSSQPDGSQDDQNIQTGDSMAPYVGTAVVLILLSGLGIAIALIIRRRRLG